MIKVKEIESESAGRKRVESASLHSLNSPQRSWIKSWPQAQSLLLMPQQHAIVSYQMNSPYIQYLVMILDGVNFAWKLRNVKSQRSHTEDRSNLWLVEKSTHTPPPHLCLSLSEGQLCALCLQQNSNWVSSNFTAHRVRWSMHFTVVWSPACDLLSHNSHLYLHLSCLIKQEYPSEI